MANTGDDEQRPHPGSHPKGGSGAHGAPGRPAGNDDDAPRWPGGGVKGEDEERAKQSDQRPPKPAQSK